MYVAETGFLFVRISLKNPCCDKSSLYTFFFFKNARTGLSIPLFKRQVRTVPIVKPATVSSPHRLVGCCHGNTFPTANPVASHAWEISTKQRMYRGSISAEMDRRQTYSPPYLYFVLGRKYTDGFIPQEHCASCIVKPGHTHSQ